MRRRENAQVGCSNLPPISQSIEELTESVTPTAGEYKGHWCFLDLFMLVSFFSCGPTESTPSGQAFDEIKIVRRKSLSNIETLLRELSIFVQTGAANEGGQQEIFHQEIYSPIQVSVDAPQLIPSSTPNSQLQKLTTIIVTSQITTLYPNTTQIRFPPPNPCNTAYHHYNICIRSTTTTASEIHHHSHYCEGIPTIATSLHFPPHPPQPILHQHKTNHGGRKL
ncbi:hypothetical protein Fot_05854 [Forsythia ovata]|uniref:Uncharacterized protein n=1 Tax=Forsythia ovata TaxID=205694 RepID=A0ABD1WRW4_9LAMI